MAENIPIRDESRYPTRRSEGWSLERLMRVSWGAIFAGFVVAFATQVLLLLLGAAIGLSAWNPTTATDPQAWGWGMGIWLIISTLISLFVGGMVAGRLAGIPRSIDSALHGAATWAMIIFASLLLSGAAMGQVFGLVGGAVDEPMRTATAAQQQMHPQIQQPEQVLHEAAQVGEGAMWALFLATLLGAMAAMGGGWLGTPEDIDELREGHHRRNRTSPYTGEVRNPPTPM